MLPETFTLKKDKGITPPLKWPPSFVLQQKGCGKRSRNKDDVVVWRHRYPCIVAEKKSKTKKYSTGLSYNLWKLVEPLKKLALKIDWSTIAHVIRIILLLLCVRVFVFFVVVAVCLFFIFFSAVTYIFETPFFFLHKSAIYTKPYIRHVWDIYWTNFTSLLLGCLLLCYFVENSESAGGKTALKCGLISAPSSRIWRKKFAVSKMSRFVWTWPLGPVYNISSFLQDVFTRQVVVTLALSDARGHWRVSPLVFDSCDFVPFRINNGKIICELVSWKSWYCRHWVKPLGLPSLIVLRLFCSFRHLKFSWRPTFKEVRAGEEFIRTLQRFNLSEILLCMWQASKFTWIWIRCLQANH